PGSDMIAKRGRYNAQRHTDQHFQDLKMHVRQTEKERQRERDRGGLPRQSMAGESRKLGHTIANLRAEITRSQARTESGTGY
ncbi:hypothetical protein KIPB_001073, partial [Kipferlia bialata]